jgi:phosphonate transport system ATP-binding protein
MRLIREVCAERGLPAIINIHDVVLAQSFTERIIGLRAGKLVFDGPPADLDDSALTMIYGEEDWTAMRKAKLDDEIEDERETEERMAGLV